MVNGKKYPYTKQGKAAAAAAKATKKTTKAKKTAKAEGGMLSKVKNTQNEDIKDASDAKPAFRTPLPFMCGGGAYKSGKPKKSKSNMRKAEGGPVMKDKPVNNKERDNPEQEDIRYSRNRNNNNNKSNGNGNGRKN